MIIIVMMTVAAIRHDGNIKKSSKGSSAAGPNRFKHSTDWLADFPSYSGTHA